ncbi:TolC family protein [Synechococcus sp. PCC 7336]|uniref:TolC family protein n=1 Tax=Synechococcus sp. PCC 7336 TaxID=195250 RepID=UPI00034682A9|nr:TolC family protein [Synechococcus sp. PCC 7336]
MQFSRSVPQRWCPPALAGAIWVSTWAIASPVVWAKPESSQELLTPPTEIADAEWAIAQAGEGTETFSPIDDIQLDRFEETGGFSPIDDIPLGENDIPLGEIERASELLEDGDEAAQLEEEINETFPDRGLVAPPAIVPDDPQDIVTPEAPPLLDFPADLPPVEGIDAAETLQLPNEPFQVRVESIRGLSLDEALARALERNSTIRQAELDVEIARKGVRQARGEFFPQLSTSVNYSFSDPASPDIGSFSAFLIGDGAPATDSNITNVVSGQIRFDFTVIDGGGRIARNLAADRALAVAEFNLAQTIQDVLLDVGESYYSLQLADTTVLVEEADVEESRASLRDAEARQRAGVGTRFDVLQAQSELANNQVELIQALNNQRVSRFDLARLLSFEETVEVAATDPIVPTETWGLSLEETLVLAFENRAEFESLREQVEQLRQNAQNALSNVRPNVSIFSTFDYQAQLQDTFSQTSFIERGYSVGATFNWTFFDGWQSLSAAQQSDLQRQQTRLSFAEARNNIRFEVENAFFSLNSFREQIEAAKVALTSSQEELRLARLRFEAGVGTQTEVLDAQGRLAIARQNLADAVSNYNLTIVQLKRAVNGL